MQLLKKMVHPDLKGVTPYRPHYKEEYDLIHMESYFYFCKTSENFLEPTLEDYEENNGMKALWINIFDAIDHNKKVIESKDPSMGFSIIRETYALEEIARQLFTNKEELSA